MVLVLANGVYGHCVGADVNIAICKGESEREEQRTVKQSNGYQLGNKEERIIEREKRVIQGAKRC